MLINKDGFTVDVFQGEGEYFEIGSKDSAELANFLIKRLRQKREVSLKELSLQIVTSIDDEILRNRQNKPAISIEELERLIIALDPGHDFLISQIQAG